MSFQGFAGHALSFGARIRSTVVLAHLVPSGFYCTCHNRISFQRPITSASDVLRLARERFRIRVALLSQHDIAHPFPRREGDAEQAFSQ